MARRWFAKLFVLYLCVLFGLTLGGFYHLGATRNLIPFRTIEHDLRKGGWEFLVNFVGNLVITLPIGWFLPLLLGRKCNAVRVGATAMGLSVVIEVLQGLSRRRVADVDDVILNTVGGLCGYGIWLILRDRVLRSRWFRSESADERLPIDP